LFVPILCIVRSATGCARQEVSFNTDYILLPLHFIPFHVLVLMVPSLYECIAALGTLDQIWKKGSDQRACGHSWYVITSGWICFGSIDQCWHLGWYTTEVELVNPSPSDLFWRVKLYYCLLIFIFWHAALKTNMEQSLITRSTNISFKVRRFCFGMCVLAFTLNFNRWLLSSVPAEVTWQWTMLFRVGAERLWSWILTLWPLCIQVQWNVCLMEWCSKGMQYASTFTNECTLNGHSIC